MCRVAAVKQLPVHHHGADYIFWHSIGIIEFISDPFENRVLIKPVLGVAVSVCMGGGGVLSKGGRARGRCTGWTCSIDS